MLVDTNDAVISDIWQRQNAVDVMLILLIDDVMLVDIKLADIKLVDVILDISCWVTIFRIISWLDVMLADIARRCNVGWYKIRRCTHLDIKLVDVMFVDKKI
jgi:hypothetical protein